MSTATTHVGTCGLCGEEGELQDSHLMPKWAYKRLQQSEKGRQDPIRVAGGTAIITSEQITQHLLCKNCEQLFSIEEDYVARLTKMDDAGALTILSSLTRIPSLNGEVAELASNIDARRIAYFAASVIWRASVMSEVGRCQLGRYQEDFRLYLLGKTDFPSEASVSMLVLESSSTVARPEQIVIFPSSRKISFAWLHGFIICGLAFRCFVGRSLNEELRQVNLAGINPVKYTFMIKAQNFGDFHEIYKVSLAATVRGKLARVAVRKPR